MTEDQRYRVAATEWAAGWGSGVTMSTGGHAITAHYLAGVERGEADHAKVMSDMERSSYFMRGWDDGLQEGMHENYPLVLGDLSDGDNLDYCDGHRKAGRVMIQAVHSGRMYGETYLLRSSFIGSLLILLFEATRFACISLYEWIRKDRK